LIDPDGELVSRIARGDQRAARALIDRHLPKMIALARRLLGNQADAEDVAQDVFLKVWTHAAQWKPGGAKFETWMHRVAINLCYDRLRKRRPVGLDDIEDPVDEAPLPGSALAEADVSKSVDAALARLPERQRAAIVLCHYQGLTNIEAAKALEVSVEALESLLARGRRTLRESLKPRLPDLLEDT
jgi:RNA polymerase sigma factor (sigma-70 family)